MVEAKASTLRGNKVIAAALSAITAAVVGIILNLAVGFALHVLFREMAPLQLGPLTPEWSVLISVDWRAAALSAFAISAVFRLKLGMIPMLALCALAGVILTHLF